VRVIAGHNCRQAPAKRVNSLTRRSLSHSVAGDRGAHVGRVVRRLRAQIDITHSRADEKLIGC